MKSLAFALFAEIRATTLFRNMGMDWWSGQAEMLQGRIEVGEPYRGFAPYLDGEYIG